MNLGVHAKTAVVMGRTQHLLVPFSLPWLWLRVGAAIALLGGLLWLLAEHDVGLPALLRSAAWGLVVWVGCGLIWIGLAYGQGLEDTRAQWSRINRVDRPEASR